MTPPGGSAVARADPGDAECARVDEAVVGAAVEEQRPPARRLLELRVRREAALGEVAGVDVGRSLEPAPAGVRRCEVGDATGDLGDAPYAGERDAVALAPPPEHVDVAVDEAGDDRARQRAGRGPCGDGRGDLGGRSRGGDDAVLDGDGLDARVLRIEREDVTVPGSARVAVPAGTAAATSVAVPVATMTPSSIATALNAGVLRVERDDVARDDECRHTRDARRPQLLRRDPSGMNLIPSASSRGGPYRFGGADGGPRKGVAAGRCCVRTSRAGRGLMAPRHAYEPVTT